MFPWTHVYGLLYGLAMEDVVILFRERVVLDVPLLGINVGEVFVILANPMDFFIFTSFPSLNNPYNWVWYGLVT